MWVFVSVRGLSPVAASGGHSSSRCAGLSRCGAQAPDAQAQQLWLTGLATPWHVGSSWTGARTGVPCIGRQTLNHCATREALSGALNPLSSCTRKQRGKKKSLASSAAPGFFPDSLPASRGALAPFRLCSRCQPQSSPWDPTSEARASAPSPHPPRRVSRQASRAGECCSAPVLCAGISPLCPPHPCGCALLRGSKASPLRPPQSPPTKGLPSGWKPFLLHSSLPEVPVPSLFFCLCFFFFLFPYPGTWGVSCLLGGLRSSTSIQ